MTAIFDNPARIGLLALALALALALGAVVAAILAGRGYGGRRTALTGAARNAMVVNAVLVTLAMAILLRAFLLSDFALSYVAQNSASSVPTLYKWTGMWSAHEGSLLLWVWFLALYGAAVAVLHGRSERLALPWVIATMATVQAGMLGLVLFTSNPFALLLPVPAEGQGMNPLLQDPGIAFHPPLLYLGYVGFTVPFAFAISALIRGHDGGEWVRAVRRWTLFAWMALTSGIVLGGFWAYYELGWGGYWGWDPVENASLMPWLAGTALLHSMMVQDKRGAFRLWNQFLVVTTFVLTLLGGFLVRSGVLTSVHAFAVDPERGAWMLGLLTLAMVAGYGLIIARASRVPEDNVIESPLSREALILVNNVVLVLAALIVLVGTLFPLVVEVFSESRLSVGAPYYNAVVTPLMAGLLVFVALGPAVPWRRMPLARLVRRFAWPGAIAVAAAGAALAAGGGMAATLGTAGGALLIAASLRDIASAIAARRASLGEGWTVATWRTGRIARRRIGGLVAHSGLGLMALGIVASTSFQSEQIVFLRPGEATGIAGYVITLDRLTEVTRPNHIARRAEFSVVPPGKSDTLALAAERRSYTNRRMTTTESALRRSLGGDLHVILGDESQGGAVLQLYWNPLVWVVWLSWLVMFGGAGLALSQSGAQAALLRQRVPERAFAQNGGARAT